MQIHLGRNGQPLGVFSIEQVLGGIRSGQLLPTDIAWHEGLQDWQPLSSLTVLQQPRAAAEPQPAAAQSLKTEPRHEPLQAPAVAAASAAMRPSAAKPHDNKAGWFAGWSFGLGIASLVFWIITAIPSVICGHVAISRFKKRADRSGRWMAVSGLVISYLMILLPTAGLVFIYPIMQDISRTAESCSKARDLILACRSYAEDNEKRLPPSLETLADEKLLADDKLLRCPLLNDDSQIGYHYFGSGMKLDDPPDKVVLISKGRMRDGKQVVARLDGSVEVMAVPELPRGK